MTNDIGALIEYYEKEKAIATNKVWEIHWYPETPVGFCSVLASTLSAAIEAIEAATGGHDD
jgi:hypothetical protein